VRRRRTRTLKNVHDIDAGLDVRHIHEHRALTEPGPQVVEEAAGMAGTVLTPVADENAGRDATSK
jgi:hypothetical protein